MKEQGYNPTKERMYAVMVDGKQTPAKMYSSYDEAEAEAKRLTIQERRISFVMLAITKIELNEVKITSLA